MKNRILTLLAGALLCLGPAAYAQRSVILATTTSTQDSGLLDVLVPMFQKQTGFQVKTIAVGSGQALAMGRKGEADVLLVHSPDAEKTFMAEGPGINRRLVMHNDFVVLGPPADPAGLKAAPSAPEAFRKVAARAVTFVSRADQSGTHAQEKKLWKAAGIDPAGKPWYLETGQGMGQTLNVASEKRGYTLSDRGTYLALKKRLGLAIVSEGDASLANIYHVIEIDPAKYPKVNAAGGKAFAAFMVSAPVQEVIRTFGVDKFGSPLFFPDAGKKDN
ncbi:substrate-binding domain-containing protein [Mesoterricola silvestris]|uniref:Tungsten ABC transporter substrate-binding protein n=1 Tax=Mesoterricola silvestris TaxID=2927979 RepID=A0AA48K796_9BACT|nr:substrate-binding domain-containing protein [Mesoterricola silvestris]BDU70940.1 tungsten ABC transporter substrate-binding protein [Mesoterricola silvestris]